jgi:nucleolar protein 12
MEEYCVGALSSLISSKNSSDKSELESLFHPTIIKEETKVAAIAEVPYDDDIDDDDGAVKSKRKKKDSIKSSKRVKKEAQDDSSDEEDKVTLKYQQPSRQFQVGNEEINKGKGRDLEKEKRTVFVGNCPTSVTSDSLKKLFRPYGKIEAVRLRGAARPDLTTTKKLAMIKKNFNEKRHNIIAYVRYANIDDTKKSLALNGHILAGHTLRVDLVVKDGTCNIDVASKKEHDQSKAVFVGNLGFSVEEDEVRQHFSRCGLISDVRIVRDSKTGMGKGFCYINFHKKDSVETALDLLSGSQLSGRTLRVSRSMNRAKKTVKQVPKVKAKGAFASKKKIPVAAEDTKIKKVAKKELKPSFEGKKATDDKHVAIKKKKKNQNQGERQRKLAAQLLAEK